MATNSNPEERILLPEKGYYYLAGHKSENKSKDRTLPIIQAIYSPRRKYPDMPKFAQARKAFNAYKKATGDIKGTIDLLLTYVERSTAFTIDFGDIDMSFYERLETALYNAADLIKDSPTRIQLYEHFQPRFDKLLYEASGMGCG